MFYLLFALFLFSCFHFDKLRVMVPIVLFILFQHYFMFFVPFIVIMTYYVF